MRSALLLALFSLLGCGSQSFDFKELEPNDIPGQAKDVGILSVAAPVAIGASLRPAGDVDFFPFTVTAFADVRLQTFDKTGVGCDRVDTLLALIAADGATSLAENDDLDPFVNTCSLINARLAPGDYFAKVTAVKEVQISNYQLKLSLLSLCGDNVAEGGEACDDGNVAAGDGCRSDCTSEVCGDGLVDAGEDCDDQNLSNTDACLNNCQSASCGDGAIFTGDEVCDDGNNADGDGCSQDCRSELCGDGVLDPQDQCDDGNSTNGDGCRSNCSLELCGDGVVDPQDQCDDGNVADGDGCRGDCSKLELCPDGVEDADEQCDDDNLLGGDGCRSDCTVEVCGDGLLDPQEQCDDGNVAAGDGCRSDCTSEVCGDGLVDASEDCDDQNLLNTDACLNNCQSASCGDGIIFTGNEQCDDSNTTNGDGCDDNCQSELSNIVCGDGLVDAGEDCDDQNLSNTDACLNICQSASCGDGVIFTGNEQCDDGNLALNDGCNASCLNEPGHFGELEPNNGTGLFQFKEVGTPTVVLHGAIAPATDVDVYQFTVLFTADVRIQVFDGDPQLSGCSNVDSAIELIAADGVTLLASDDEGSGSACSIIDSGSDISAAGLLPGKYFVRIREFGQDEIINQYQIKISFNALCGDGLVQGSETCDDGNSSPEDGCNDICQSEAGQFYEVEPNNEVGSNVKDIPFQDVLVHGEISPVGDSDLYEFVISSPSSMIFETFDSGGPGGCLGIDTELLLFAIDPVTGEVEVAVDDKQVPLGDDDSGVFSCSRLELNNLPPNLYQLRVTEFGGDALIAYTMQVTIL